MKEKQNVKKANKPVLILLIIVMLATTIFSLYAYAKYQSLMKKTSNGVEVAQWNINFESGQATFNYDYIVANKIAPGTTGQFNIQINGQSETAFEYIVRLSEIKNKPKNLKFYVIKVKDENGNLTHGVDIKENRAYFEDINDLRIDGSGAIDATTKTATSADSNTGFLRNKDLGDTAIEEKEANIYESEYKTNDMALEIHWIWPYNNGDGESVNNGVLGYNEAGEDSHTLYNEDHLVSLYDQDDVKDSKIGKMSFTVTIVATQKRPGDATIVKTLIETLYWTFEEGTGTLKLSSMPFEGQTEADNIYNWNDGSNSNKNPAWDSYKSSITKVKIVDGIQPKSTFIWFSNCQGIVDIDLELLDTSNLTNMEAMFAGCRSLKKINVSEFDTSKVTNMSMMFSGCVALESIDVSSFNTSKVTNMGLMFVGCEALQSIYATDSFVVNEGTNTSGMFAACNVLKGEKGTACSGSNPVDGTYARIDGGDSNPGYFTRKQ